MERSKDTLHKEDFEFSCLFYLVTVSSSLFMVHFFLKADVHCDRLRRLRMPTVGFCSLGRISLSRKRNEFSPLKVYSCLWVLYNDIRNASGRIRRFPSKLEQLKL